MREQLLRCRRHVGVLAALARRGALGEAEMQPVDAFIDDCLNHWQLLRPGVVVDKGKPLPAVRISVDQALPQALINLLNNAADANARSEEHTSELQSLMRISYAVFCLKTKTQKSRKQTYTNIL